MSSLSICRMLRCLSFAKDMSNRTLFFSLRYVHNFPVYFQSASFLLERKIGYQVIIDMKNTEQIWRKYNNDELLQRFLTECFEKNEGSLAYATDLIFLASERMHSPCEIIYSIVVAFLKYIQKSDVPFSPSLIEKREVLSAVINLKNYNLIQLVCKMLKINENAHCFKDFIDELIQEQRITEAAFCIRALNLYQEYPVEKVLFPLLFEGKYNIVQIYLSNQAELQLETAKKLDNLLNVKKSNSRIEINSQITSRRLFKILTAFINIFKISPEHCTNLHFIRSKGAINILICKRTQQTVSETTWEEMVMSVVGENKELKESLIQNLLLKGYQKTALKMCEKLNIPEDTFKIITSNVKVQKNSESLQEEENEFREITDSSIVNYDDVEDVPNNLTIELNTSDIKFVTSKDEFIKCINDISQNYEMIGVDSEWKPNFGLSHERLSLIQLAVRDKVYILDILSLTKCLDAEQWDKFMDDIFGNPKIIKLGCGIISDVNMITDCNKGTAGKAIRFSHILDIAIFYQKLQEVYPEEMNCSDDDDKHATKGLSKLCELILGKPLNKEERLCDWEKRPLTDSQLEYAALDAYCLLQMYDKLKEFASKKNMNFDHLSQVAIVMTVSLWKPKKIKRKKTERAFNIHTPVPVEQFKVVMDSDLDFLGKKLKRYGADVLILKKSDTCEDIVEVAESDGRVIICSEIVWEMVKNRLKGGVQSYKVSNKSNELSTVSDIFQLFNVQLNRMKIFTRCFVCNSEYGVKLEPDDLNLLRKQVLGKEIEDLNAETCDLKLLSRELQPIVNHLFKSNTTIKFNNFRNTGQNEKYAFLCARCGNIY